MIKSAKSLIAYLDSVGQFSASSSVYKLFSYAGIEDHMSRIDAAAADRQQPFKRWFGGKDRVYLPFGEDNSQSEDKEAALRAEFPEILEWIGTYLRENPEEASLLQGRTASGRKLGGKFFSQVLKKRLHDLYVNNSQNINIDQGRFIKIFSDLYTGNYNESQGSLYESSGASSDIISIEEENNIFSGEEYDKVAFLDELSGTISDANIISKDFLSSPLRGNKNVQDYSVVISTNPVDVAAMSTGRSWTSCMNLDNGGLHSSDVFCEIKAGSFVAYLIKKEDVDVESPLARIRARRFDNAEGKAVAILEDEVYSDGTDYPGFEDTVQGWIDGHQGELKYGTYYLRGGGWSDTFDETYELEKEYPADIDSLSEMFLNPDKILESKRDTYVVTDNLWDQYSGHWAGVEDEHWDRPGLRFSYLPDEGMAFPTMEAASEWASQQPDHWKYELSDYVKNNRDLCYEDEDAGAYRDSEDEDSVCPWEGMSLDGEGESLMEFASGAEERYTVSKSTAESKAEKELGIISNRLYSAIKTVMDKADDGSELISKELISKLIDRTRAEKHSLYKLKTYAMYFPEYFSKEELLKLLSGDEYNKDLTSLSKAYLSMDAGPERDSMRSDLLSEMSEKLDYEKLRMGYERAGNAYAERSGFGNPYRAQMSRRVERGALESLHKASPLPNSFSDKLIEMYNLAEQDYEEDDPAYVGKAVSDKIQDIRDGTYKRKDPNKLSRDSAKRLQNDMIHALKAINAHNPRTISFYKDILKNMKVVSAMSMASLSGSYVDIATMLHAISDVGVSGEPLIPELERLFKEADNYKLKDTDMKHHGWSDERREEVLREHKHSFKRSIINKIRRIRGQA